MANELGKRWRREKSTSVDGIVYSKGWRLRVQSKFGRTINIVCSFLLYFINIYGAPTYAGMTLSNHQDPFPVSSNWQYSEGGGDHTISMLGVEV